jgi:hypothetical protein
VLIQHNAAPCGAALCLKIGLDFVDADSVRSFLAFADLERNSVSLLELVERNVLELIGMKEEIFLLSIALDEAETFISFLGYCSFLHGDGVLFSSKYQSVSRNGSSIPTSFGSSAG